MKKPALLFLLAAAALVAWTAGCSHIEVTPEGDPHRVLNGTVEFRADVALPADAVVVVRILDMSGIEQMRLAANKDLPIGDRAKPEPLPQVLAEQTVNGVTGNSVPFHIEYTADDELLRHGLNVDARISYDGKIRFRTANSHVVTLANAEYPHTVWVEPASR
jgi:uncharacterized lipoprotein YbaY